MAGSNIDAEVAYGDRNTRSSFVTMEERRKRVGTNFRSGTKFCLASNSPYTSGTLGGTLGWSGH